MENLLNQFDTYEEAREFSKRMIKNANTKEELSRIKYSIDCHPKAPKGLKGLFYVAKESVLCSLKIFMIKYGLDENDKDVEHVIKKNFAPEETEEVKEILRGN